jgi:hypothetical protein
VPATQAVLRQPVSPLESQQAPPPQQQRVWLWRVAGQETVLHWTPQAFPLLVQHKVQRTEKAWQAGLRPRPGCTAAVGPLCSA